MPVPRVAVVVLTMGSRAAELDAALRSVLAQRDVVLDVVCVGNGWEPTDLPAGVRGHGLPTNVGIPAGRNAGVPLVSGDLLLFVDDDARLPDPDFLLTAASRFLADPTLGAVQPRVDASTGQPPTRWIPRVHKGDRHRSSPVMTLWEGVLVVRRAAFEAAGGWAGPFFYAHEGIELAWRIWDAGFSVWYAGDLRCVHPVVDPRRHDEYFRLNARNRVFLARRNLPVALRPVYLGVWTAVQVARALRHPGNIGTLRPWFAGWLEGWRADPGDVRIMRWATVARMARAGRPPVV